MECPKSYLPAEFAVDFDRTKESLGPYGSGNQAWFGIHNGKCSSDSTTFKADDIQKLGQCAIQAFERHLQGTFMWCAHNEIEPRWDYVKAWDNGWINKANFTEAQTVANAARAFGLDKLQKQGQLFLQ